MIVDLVRTVTRDGFRLDGALQKPAQTPGTPRDALVLVPGAGGSFYSSSLYDGIAPKLLESGLAVLRINTRGHDEVSIAATSNGARRQGAAYEAVCDCRDDLLAWTDWLYLRGFERVALLGHSLGAVKSLYAVAHEPDLRVDRLIALSPPRLSYSHFLAGDRAAAFKEDHERASRLIAEGKPDALIESSFPRPMLIAARGFCEKYGPEERFNFLNFLGRLRVPTLFTFGSVEVATHPAFAGLPMAVRQGATPGVAVEVIDGADHFYAGLHQPLADAIDAWLARG